MRYSFISLLILASTVAAQKPPPPPKVNPKAPVLTATNFLGAQVGKSIELTLTGKNLANPTGVWTSFPATVTIPTDKKNGKSATSLRVKLDIPANAPGGFHSLRLATTQGMSNARLFCLDTLPIVREQGALHSIDKAQAVTVPCVIDGQIDASKSDHFRFNAKAGQTLTFETFGRRLGSAVDPQLTLIDVASRSEVPGAFDNDAPARQTDAQFVWKFDKAGEYVIAVRDTLYRGSSAYRYRLRISDGPCALTPYPLAAQRGTKTTVQFTGPKVDDAEPVTLEIPEDLQREVISVTPKNKGGSGGWPVSLFLSDHQELTEQEPNNDLKQAQRLPILCGVSGRFLEKGDRDHFVFNAKKGQKLTIEAQTHRLFSPTEVYMTIHDAKGKQLQASNPAKGATLTFTAPADGDYVVAIEHLHYWSGPSEVYRLVIKPVQPQFDISVGLDRFDVVAGKSISLPILVTRRGYNEAIEVSVVGHPALSGKLTIAKGQPKKAGLSGGTLQITVKAGTKPGPIAFKIQAIGKVGKTSITEFASVRSTVDQITGNLPYPPPSLLTQLALAVKSK